MALIKCKECGHDVSTSAAACPNCGAPDFRPDTRTRRQKWWSHYKGLVTGLLIIGAIILWLYAMGQKLEKPTTETESAPPEASRSEPAIKELNASIRLSDTQILITNDDNFGWRKVKMEINGGILRDGYVLENQTIAAGGTYVVGMGQFAKSDGTRFNPFTMKVQKFVISASDSRGRLRTWIGGWK